MSAFAATASRIEQLLASGQTSEALALAEQAAKRGNSPEAQRLLGLVLAQAQQDDRALYALEQAARSFPSDPAINSVLGVLHARAGKWANALPYIRANVAARPGDPGAYQQLLFALIELGHVDEAAAMVIPAIRQCPDSQALLTLAATVNRSGSPARVIDFLAHLRNTIGPIAEFEHSEMLLWMNLEGVSPETVLEAHVRCGRTMAEKYPTDTRPFDNPPDPDRLLRIGYISQDFRNRSAGHFSESLITGHDRSRFQVFCYHETLGEDALTQRLKSVVHGWRDIEPMDDRVVADQIRADGIDILVDLTGHTGRARLIPFCFRPAPVQVTYMGYPHSTGLPTMDYRMVDALTDPPGYESHSTETLVRLDGCFLCYSPPVHAPEIGPARSGDTLFGCFNHTMKLTPRAVKLWARILAAVPGSKLLLKARGFSAIPRVKDITGQFKAAGIDPRRVTCRAETTTPEDHLRTYHEVDIALDPFPYNGTTTTLEALWMGVPVVTLEGDCHRARVGVSLLTNAGLPELIARTENDYVRIAADLARDRAALASLRSGLRARLAGSVICDRSAFVHKVEHAYRDMWRAWCAKS